MSGPGESHPRALPEPCVNVSAHTAPITQLFTVSLLVANGHQKKREKATGEFVKNQKKLGHCLISG